MPASPDVRLLELIGDLQGLLELAELRDGLLHALGRTIPSDWVSLNEIGADAEHVFTVAHPPLPEHLHDTFARHAHENPLVARFARTTDTRPYRFSDVISQEELHTLALYRECYAELGLEHQIAFVIKVSCDDYVAIALSRRRHDFTTAEQELLDRARPYLIQIYRNAIAYTTLHAEYPASRTTMIGRLLDRGLTPAEADVLIHVAHGQSNADIAHGLNVSERTIGKHLQRAYRKLGVTDRSQAATVAWTISQPPKVTSSHNAPPL
jgi:DNA-binding CsgD family transcriptional regulator